MGERSGILLVALAACAWGTWSIFLRYAGVEFTVATPLVFVRLGLFTGPIDLRGGSPSNWDRGSKRLLFANAVFAGGNVLTYFGAIANTSVALAIMTHYLAPVIIALVAPWFEGERVPGAKASAIIACVGLLLILEPWGQQLSGSNHVLGIVLGCASAVFFAGTVLTGRHLVPRIGAAPTMAYQALIAGVMLAPLAFPGILEVSASAWGLLALGALIPGAAAGVLFLKGLDVIGSSRAAILTYLEPLVGLIVGWVVFQEALGPLVLAGAALILGAGYLSSVARARAPAPDLAAEPQASG